jgi:hypothetical protein
MRRYLDLYSSVLGAIPGNASCTIFAVTSAIHLLAGFPRLLDGLAKSDEVSTVPMVGVVVPAQPLNNSRI